MIEIVRATPEDAGELLTVQRAAYVTEALLHDSFEIPPLWETCAEIRAAITDSWLVKAVAGTRIVGTVRARVSGGTCHVGRLSVAPDRQGQGIGTRLMGSVEAEFAGRVERFELYTGPRSARNLHLYERLGYRRIPTPPDGIPTVVYLEKPANPG